MPIIIHTHKTERPLIGKSHWWGAPDLPADTPFPYVTLDDGTPEPLTFVLSDTLRGPRCSRP